MVKIIYDEKENPEFNYNFIRINDVAILTKTFEILKDSSVDEIILNQIN